MMESEDEVEVMYIVESILNKRFDRDGRPEYFVKWKGFKQRTWEPVDNLHTVPEMIYEYEEANKQRRRQNPDLNPKKAVRESKEIVARKKKLTKLAHKENDANNMIDLDSSVENRKSEYLASSRDQCEQNKEEIQQSPRDHPRVKFTREFAHDQAETSGSGQKPSLYRDQVQRITAVQKRGDKWMARVRFSNSEQRWQERDIVRLLHPMRLLQFYEQLHQQRQKQ